MPWISKKEYEGIKNLIAICAERIDVLGLTTQEMLKFAAANGITEIEMRGLKCKITTAAQLDADRLTKLEQTVNSMKLGLGMGVPSRKLGGI